MCERCGKNPPEIAVILDSLVKRICWNCYERLKTECDSAKQCETCTYFGNANTLEEQAFCKKMNLTLDPSAKIGATNYYIYPQKCVHYLSAHKTKSV